MKLKRFITSMLAITELELRKIRHDQSQIWMRLIQPILWLTVFGVTFSAIRVIPTGDYTYLQFLTPGILAQSVIFVAIFYGINVVWERDLGLLNKLMSTPAPRSSIVLGKSLAGGLRGILQALGILLIALVIGIDLILTPLSILGMLVIIILCGICFSSMSMALASIFRTRERMMGVGQAITMPLFFASSAIYPVSIMPDWLQVIAVANPLSYVVDALRSLLVTGDLSGLGLDVLILVASAAVLLFLASLGFKRMLV
ncbi:MAG TPA: multidrug ABC transporter permease [Dehalococcoidia bacterium]|nr:multidrug ABC transporter permease [Dehalococcoidia bacterium]HAS28390.1 multidrug ABC transporter permease [Dehalococcoidia bacterium]